jgi:alpha-tubulin suppressor-like RCC1 family protein
MRKVAVLVAVGWVGVAAAAAACGDDPATPGGAAADAAPEAATSDGGTSDATPDAAAVDAAADADGAVARPNEVVKVATGGYHSCALLGSGKVWCWGNNMAGQLGLGSSDGDAHPTATLVPGITDVVDVVVGRYTTCVVHKDGKVRCWGLNSHRQLAVDAAGDASCTIFGAATSCRLAPVELPIAGTLVKLALGFDYGCALSNQGGQAQIRCWGGNAFGQLGHDSAADDTCTYLGAATPCKAQPTVVSVTNATDLTAGYHHVAAIVQGGAVHVWGGNEDGQHGTGAKDGAPHPVPVVVPGVQAASLVPSTGSAGYTCIITPAGKWSCWGANAEGQCGQPFAPAATPATLDVTSASAGAGGRHVCVLSPASVVSCWGDNSSGELGRDPADAGTSTPTPGVVGGVSNVKRISVGGFNACAIKTDDSVWCWGRFSQGESGRDPALGGVGHVPVQVAGVGQIPD